MLVFDGENFKSDGFQIVEHLKKENDSEYRYISLTDVANEVIGKAKERKECLTIRFGMC